jgi:peptide deformylase
MANPRDKIISLPDPRLRQRSSKVGVVSKDIKQIVHDMEAAVLDWEESRPHEVGVALAAVQIGEQLRILVIRKDYNDKTNKTFEVFINPVITKYEGTIEEDFEGCLSISDVYGKVRRYTKVRVKAKNLQGREFRITVDGFLARVLQHEVDHTNGIPFIDHIKDNKDAFFRLMEDGNLVKLDYEKDIQSNNLLW